MGPTVNAHSARQHAAHITLGPHRPVDATRVRLMLLTYLKSIAAALRRRPNVWLICLTLTLGVLGYTMQDVIARIAQQPEIAGALFPFFLVFAVAVVLVVALVLAVFLFAPRSRRQRGSDRYNQKSGDVQGGHMRRTPRPRPMKAS